MQTWNQMIGNNDEDDDDEDSDDDDDDDDNIYDMRTCPSLY